MRARACPGTRCVLMAQHAPCCLPGVVHTSATQNPSFTFVHKGSYLIIPWGWLGVRTASVAVAPQLASRATLG
eukprot:12900321-Alexandrium_andersonii.AAC.1